MTKELFDPAGIIRAFNERKVEYMVIGGLAAARHGVIRATRDIDIVYDREWDNVTSLLAALESIDAAPATEHTPPLRPEVLVRRVDLKLNTSHGSVHLLNAVDGVPDFRALMPGAETVLNGEPFRVCALEDLRAMKRAAGRAKDLIDLAELDALHGEGGG